MNVRIIPRLDVKGPNLVKGVHLEGLRGMVAVLPTIIQAAAQPFSNMSDGTANGH